MANRHTFTISPIKELVDRYVENPKLWIDPFAGWHSPVLWTNDLNPEAPTMFHMKAHDFLKKFVDGEWAGILLDPPYSPRQVSECYSGFGIKTTGRDTSAAFWAGLKDEAARLLKPGGIAITCGWNSNGVGKSRGFEAVERLLVPHGGWHNDTIVTVERKVRA